MRKIKHIPGEKIPFTDHDVVIIERSLLDGGCAVREGLACIPCFKAAQTVVGAFRDQERLDDRGRYSIITNVVELDGPWHFDVQPDDSDVEFLRGVLTGVGETGCIDDAEYVATYAVAALRRFGRLSEQSA